MSNTYNNLVLDAFAAADVVSREMVGLIPAVARNATADRAAQGQTIRIPQAPASASATIAAGQLAPDTGDQTIANATVQIDQFKAIPIRWEGEEVADLNTGPGWNTVFGDQLLQGMRTHVNEMENLLADLYVGAANGVDPAGTALFDAANYKDLAAVQRMLDDNGAPVSDRHLVLANGAAELYAGNAQNTGADTAGNMDMLMQGVLGTRFGMDLRKSGQIQDHTAGDAASGTTNDAGYAVGATVITVGTAGSGDYLAGDIIYFNGDARGYVVAVAGAATAGTITIAAPGLKQAIPAAATAITVEASTQRNMAFSRNAIMLATRLPFAPNGDAARNVQVITDPRSGISFELREYGEYRRVHYELAIAYGAAVIKPEHLVLLAD